MTFTDIDLTAIIITKNEEETITECIESVVNAIEFAQKKRVFRTAEVILVDSASSDRTVELASKFPIKVLKMPTTWKVSSGAGRYFGMKYAKGKYISMVDGDTRISKDWYVNALPELKKKNTRLLRLANPRLNRWNLDQCQQSSLPGQPARAH